MPQGTLFITTRTADSAFPIASARVTVLSREGEVLGEDQVTAATGGVSRTFTLTAPERELSLSPGEELPYATYDVRIQADGFYTFFIRSVQIFAGEKSELPVEMIPRGQSEDEVIQVDIGPHALRTTPDLPREAPDGSERVLTRVFIPDRITVHLGAPNASAANVTVPFVDYIKNVASSEVYPTWPERSLRANILCQISLALNRIFTEWYPSRGYNFNITNSTSYDQYYVYGRNIYDSVSRIVDQIFNQYIRRPGRIDPYFAEYCNGSSVTCAGLSQWGTVSLANDGLSVEEILQFYYGDVEIVQTNDIRAIEESYPGTPLRVGSSGASVRTIQQQLNRIRVNYPAIPPINPVDGVFGSQTQEAVRAFQQIFNLTPDGVVGKRTWYRISYIYVAVKKLAELNSEGERPQYDDTSYPGLLRFGDTGSSVQALQLYLKTIAAFNPFLPDLAIDGRFGRSTENAVRAFQEYYGLFVDGVVGENTWNRIIQVYLDVTEGGRLIIRPYPGSPLRQGSSGEGVLYVQMLLNRIRPVFVTIPSLEEDGIFGPRMRSAVREFQRLFGLDVDGVVGRSTWNALNRVFGSTASGCLDDEGQETGRILRYGSSGADVRVVQDRLNTVHRALPPVPRVTVDGNFGRRTENAVIAFQRIVGLGADGVVGNATRTRLATFAAAVNAGCLPLSASRTVDEAAPREEWSEPAMSLLESAEPTKDPLPRENSLPRFGRWPDSCPWAAEVGDWTWQQKEMVPLEEVVQECVCPCSAPFSTLGIGSRGERVMEVKRNLCRLGYLSGRAPGERELYGVLTARAVGLFQWERNLPVTGKVDWDTWQCLLEE